MTRHISLGFVLALLIAGIQLQGCGGGNTQPIAPTQVMISTGLAVTGTVGSGYTGFLAASGGTAPYSWNVTGFPSGFTIKDTNAATVLVAGTPAAAATYTVTATVTDSGDQSSTFSVDVVISAPFACKPRGNESALSPSSPFAFLVKGFNSDAAPIAIGGSFTPNGDGSIKAGSADYIGFAGLSNGHTQLAVNLATSFYSVDSAGRGCLLLAVSPVQAAIKAKGNSDSSVELLKGVTPSSHVPATAATVPANIGFSFVLGEQTKNGFQSGRIIEFDQTATGGSITSGTMHVQTPADFALASFQSNYAFGVDGWDTVRRREALACTFINGSGTLSGGVGDFNDQGLPQPVSGEMDGGTGSLGGTIDSSSGRGTGKIDFPDVGFNFAFYVVNRSDFYIVSIDPPGDVVDGFSGLFSGQALATKASFTPGSLTGSYLLAGLGFDASAFAGNDDGNVAEIGNIQATAAGDVVGGNIYTNHTGGFASAAISSGTYLTQTSGRTTIVAAGSGTPVVYLTAPSSDENIVGFLVGTDALTTSGAVYTQITAAPNFSAGVLNSSFAMGSEEDLDGSGGSLDGIFTFDGAGKYSSVVDVASVKSAPAPGGTATGTFTVNRDGSGSLTFDGSSATWAILTNGTQIFAINKTGTDGGQVDPLLYVFIIERAPN
jgi:hypothetical protein